MILPGNRGTVSAIVEWARKGTTGAAAVSGVAASMAAAD
jgi:hypothetical protein